ncbi:hypothetical protein CBS9595_003159 [Malassezia furfur]|nr:hypothetical protein CBS9595_003159 [Malassezia furfur]
MQAAHATQLFQSDASLAVGQARAEKAQRTAHGAAYGHPIWLGKHVSPLPTSDDAATAAPDVDVAALASRAAGADGGLVKVITAHMAHPSSTHVWTAESGRVARATDLESGAMAQQLRGHTGPVSALASLVVRGVTLVFTASWDKSLRVWLAGDDARPTSLVVVPDAATDFVKALHVDAAHACLVSSGSDRAVRFWDLSELVAWCEARAGGNDEAPAPAPTVVGVVRVHTRPVLALASVPSAPPGLPVAAEMYTGLCVFSADSMGRVVETHVERTPDGVRCEVVREFDGPETSVYGLAPVWRLGADDTHWVADLWCASADECVRRFPLAEAHRRGTAPGRVSRVGAPLGRAPPVRADAVVRVRGVPRSVLPLGAVDDALQDLVVVGMADGDVVVWDTEGAARVVRRLEGHWHEVSYVGAWRRADGTVWLVSASLDGTVRRWALREVLRRGAGGAHEATGTGGPAAPASAGGVALTAEEEAELAELLDED